MANTKLADRQVTNSVDLTTEVINTLPAANGGTGNATNTLNSLMVGNGTGALLGLAPGTTGNVPTSNGSAWVSQAPAAGGATSFTTMMKWGIE